MFFAQKMVKFSNYTETPPPPF